MHAYRNTVARSCNHRCSGKAISITYSECGFIALGTQPAMRMRHILICGLASSTIFSHIISLTSRLKKMLLNVKCVFCLSVQRFCKALLVLRRNERDSVRTVGYCRSACEVPPYLLHCIATVTVTVTF